MCHLTNFKSGKPPFLLIFGSKIDILSSAIPQCGKIRKSKTLASTCAYVRTPIPNMEEVPYLPVPLVWQVNFESI